MAAKIFQPHIYTAYYHLLSYSFYCAHSLQKCHYSQYSLYGKENISIGLFSDVIQTGFWQTIFQNTYGYILLLV